MIVFDQQSKRRFDANGYMHIEANPISKVQIASYYGREIGNWQELGLDPNQQYKLLRPAEELEKAVPFFNGLTLLLKHEEDSARQPKKEIRIGAVGTRAFFDGLYLRNDLSFQDQTGIDAVESGGIKEISASYRYEADMTPGAYGGQPYDGVMRNIKGNHVAIVKKGRAGADVMVSDSAAELNNKTFGARLMKLKDKFLQLFKPLFAGAKLANDADPEAVIEQAATVAAEVVEEAVKAASSAAVEEGAAQAAAQGGTPPGKPAGQDNDKPQADEGAAAKPAQDTALSVESIKQKAAKLFEGISEIGGKPLDDWLKELVAALAAGAPAAEPAQPAAPAMDGLPKGMFAVDPNTFAQNIETNIKAHYAAKEKALHKVKPLVGELAPLAFDSAEGVYAYALEQQGLKPADYTSAALEGIIDGLLASRSAQRQSASLPGVANDAKPDDLSALMGGLGKVQILG